MSKTSRMYPEASGGIKTKYSGGDLIFYDDSGNEIYRIDPTNRALVPPTVGNVDTAPGLPVLHRITATALTGDVDVVLDHKTRVLDVWCVAVGGAGGTGDTITVKNGSTAITDAIDLNIADKTVARAGTIDDAQYEIAAGGTLKVTGASAVTCEVYVLGIRVS